MTVRIAQPIPIAQDVDLRRTDSHPDYWYPIAWSDEVKRGAMLARRYAGEPIAIIRAQTGELFALEDRCAHRQVPLTHGVVQGCTVKCGYHGWAYDAAGKCIDVPYLGRDRVPNGVKAYPCQEVDGLILIFPGDPQLAGGRLPQSLGAKSNPLYKTRRLNREVAAHYTFMHENLFDMNHQFLHRRQMGMIKARCLGRRHGEDWAEVDYTFSRTEGASTVGETAILGVVRKRGKADNADLMTIRTGYPYQQLRVWVGDGDPVLSVWLAYTPLDKLQRTNRTFGYLSVKRPSVPGLIDLAWPFITMFTERIFQEDKEIVEMEQAAHDAQGSDWNNEVFPPIKDLREVLARCGRPSAGDRTVP
jgi:phenylpropionate dioxygenase-like ring-hydroxylating dioxygenase large terminal subunit